MWAKADLELIVHPPFLSRHKITRASLHLQDSVALATNPG
jgi:hypothetical protein